jgi:coenzyme PQQ biosynthesis protein PqqD
MNELSQRPTRRDGVLAQEAQGQTVLLRVDDGSYYALDEIGAMIWGLADGDRSLEAIVDSLAAEFDAPREVLTSDVLDFVSELEREQLLQVAG